MRQKRVRDLMRGDHIIGDGSSVYAVCPAMLGVAYVLTDDGKWRHRPFNQTVSVAPSPDDAKDRFDDYPWTCRTWNRLSAIGVETFDNLSGLRACDLLRQKGFGTKSLREVEDALASVGMGLRPNARDDKNA